jgi:hypothetical protein
MFSPSQQFSRPAYVNCYSVAGLSVWVESDERWLTDAFDLQFSGSHLNRVPQNGEPAATIRVSDLPRPELSDGLENFEVAQDGRCFTDGAEYHIVYDDSLVSIYHDAPVRVDVWLGTSAKSGAALARLFFTAVAAATRRCGLYEMHSACVVEPETDDGVLLVGSSGAGKSTLTAQLVTAGWHYLSDDSLLLRAAAQRAEVWALRRVFAITDHLIDVGGVRDLEDALRGPMAFDPAKRRLDPFDVLPDRFRASSTPAVLLFPVVTDEGSSAAEKLTRVEAMGLLIRMCPWASYDRLAARGYLDALARLARNCAAYRVHLGADLFGDGEQTSRFVKRLLRVRA